MIVLDASVLIAYLDREDNHHGAAEALLAGAIDDDFGANPLTLAEVLVVPARDGRLEAVQTALRELEVQELPFPADTAVRLAKLRARTGRKLPECCVLLCAEGSGGSIASFDDRLAQQAAELTIPVLGR